MQDEFAKVFYDIKGTVSPDLDLGGGEVSTNTNTIDFYKELSKVLTKLSEEKRWEDDDKFDVVVFGETFEVGPFVQIETEWGTDSGTLGFSFPDDDFATVSHEGGFDSWGEHEAPYRQKIRFEVYEVVERRKIFKNLYI